MSNYEKQAVEFLEKYNCTMTVEFIKNDFHFDDDKDKRDIYKITLKRGSRKMVLNFGQSIMNSQHYQDSIPGRTYTLNGGCRTGNYKITDIEKYKSAQQLKLIKGVEPTAYSVLTLLQKYDVGTLEDFCSEFGYDEDSKKAEKTYNAVVKEYKDVCSLFNDEELSELQEIQ